MKREFKTCKDAAGVLVAVYKMLFSRNSSYAELFLLRAELLRQSLFSRHTTGDLDASVTRRPEGRLLTVLETCLCGELWYNLTDPQNTYTFYDDPNFPA